MKTLNFDKNYSILNEAQKEAVDTVYWPVMVVAWPGTGKTQIIGLRTANIILKARVNPENILITTFTEAWVIAIKQRLIDFIGNDAYRVKVSTIHSFSQDVIKSFPEKFLEYKASDSIDDIDSLEILKNILDELYKKEQIKDLYPPYNPYFYLRDIKSKIWNLKQEWVSLIKFNNSVEKQKEVYVKELLEIKPTLKKYETTKTKQEKHINKLRELSSIFESYNKLLRKRELYDFNDMINFVLEKFLEDEELRQFYAEQYQFIMLDEFQDTNNAQNKIIDLILSVSENKPNIMVVWDDDQSIYRFQWANIENMLNFSTYYKNTKIITLKNNYRSQQNILDMSAFFIDYNEERLSKKVKSINKQLISSWKNKTWNKPFLYKALNSIDEKNFVFEKIKKLCHFELISKSLKNKNIIKDFKSSLKWQISIEKIAIIVRSNREVEEWSNFLESNSIPVESKLKTNILNNPYINFIIDFLEIINNPFSNEIKLLDLLRSDLVNVDNIDVLNINKKLNSLNYIKKNKISLFSFISNNDNFDNLFLNDVNKLKIFRDKLLKIEWHIAHNSFIEYFNYFITESKILEYIEKNGNFDDIEDLFTFFNLIKDYNRKDKDFNTEKLLRKIALYREYNLFIPRQILKIERQGVQVLTAHSSKWLEYEVVFIPWLYYGNWDYKRVIERLKLPSNLVWKWVSETKENKLEEERRLFFVAATRAKKKLYISYPIWEWNKPFLPSSFIEEIQGYIFEKESDLNKDSLNLIKNNLTNLLKKKTLIKNTYEELEYIKEFLKTYKLSASDLNTFLEDPKVFLRNKVFKYPFEDNEYTIFGKVYHRVLELFFTKYKKDWILPEKNYLTWTFKLLLEKEILTLDEQKRLLEKWINWLEWYYDNYKNIFKIPINSEFNFRSRNIVFENIPLTWKIDKIENFWESDFKNQNFEWQLAFFKESIVLVDYKTWNKKSLWQIKWIDRYWNKKESFSEWKYFRQLLFYKLMCELDKDFNSNYGEIKLAIDFVEWKDWNYRFLEVDYTKEDYEEFKNIVENTWKQINNINFWKNLLKN